MSQRKFYYEDPTVHWFEADNDSIRCFSNSCPIEKKEIGNLISILIGWKRTQGSVRQYHLTVTR